MSDFSRPEYSSYVDLCREMNLGRQFQEGDACWYITVGRDGSEFGSLDHPSSAFASEFLVGADEHHDYWKSSAGRIWLPSLSDWLDRLADVGLDRIEFSPYRHAGFAWMARYQRKGFRENPETHSIDECWDFAQAAGPSREEAAGRLWIKHAK